MVRLKFETITSVTDWILKIASIIAIVIGGWWTYHVFGVTAVEDSNLTLSISTDTIGYQGNLKLLVIHARPKNLGKTPIEIGGKKAGGFHVTIKELPKNIQDGQLLEAEKLSVLVKDVDILRHYHDGYIIEPEGIYDEVEAIPLHKGLYLLEAVFDLDREDYVNAYSIVEVK